MLLKPSKQNQKCFIGHSLHLSIFGHPQFYPRDIMLARSLPSEMSVHLSVHHRPGILCLTVKHIFKTFLPSGSPVDLVFLPLRQYQIPSRTPSARVQNTRGEKILQFSTEIASISEMVRDIGLWLLRNHRWRIDTCRFWWPWVTFDPNFKVMTCYSTLNIAETTRDGAIYI